jgi:uncharacterized protein YcbX
MVPALNRLKGPPQGIVMQIDDIYRYPVKGLTPERLAAAPLSPGRCIPWDRAFALAQGDCGFDANAPAWRPKTEFLCLARNPAAFNLTVRFDEDAGLLSITAPGAAASAAGSIEASPFTDAGRVMLGRFIAAALPGEMRGAPEFVHAPGHSFCDNKTQVISLIGMGSLRALEEAAGEARHPLRFRASLYVGGIEPWEEFGWIGRVLSIGTARLRVSKRIIRCAATRVNPLTGTVDANPVKELSTNFGHTDCGVYAEVIEAGMIRPGDAIRIEE